MVGALLTYGNFTFLDLGDLNWERELELSCPINKLGTVTLYQTTRHGSLDGAGAPPHLYALRPQVIVANNGSRKGLGGAVAGMPKMGKHYVALPARPAWKESGSCTRRCSNGNAKPTSVDTDGR